jgi:hypothetical protein
MQQMSMSFGLACGTLHHAFLTLALLTLLSSLSFWSLRPDDGESVSRAATAGASMKA